jgi:C_GCAxxG_C_C family probable redox protein
MRTTGKKARGGSREDRMSRRAVALFDSGFHCAESVLTSAKERLGVRSSVVPSVATGFGAGIGRKGSLCGALTGAIMGIGLACGRQKPGQDREKAYALARKTYDRFKARFGSPYCMELIKVDLNTKAGMDKFHRLNIRALKCNKYVGACADMLERELAREGRGGAPRRRRAKPARRGGPGSGRRTARARSHR